VAERFSCPACGRDNAADQRFCTSCGSSLLRSCPTCSATNSPGARFCGSCGQGLEPAAPARDETPEAPAEERRLASVIFADISGFTGLSERMDPEDVQVLVKSCMAKLGAIVERYGGYVDKVIGDALMAVFGAPIAHEDDPERAVRAALEMQRCAVENATEFGNLALRVGVNTGEVMFAPVEAGGKATAIGDAVNTAQRIQAEAPQGGVLVGAETRRATEAAVRYSEAPSVVAKGKERPLPVWIALEVRETPVERPGRAAQLVGRATELGLLTSLWERVATEGRSHLVTVIGTPGIGKTRLAAELAAHVEAQAGRSLQGRSLPYGGSSGYGAFAQQVRSRIHI
jgi:class 3 adenylate cyclase